MTAIRNIETRKLANGGYISTIVIDEHDVYVYQPLDKMESDIINYGYSAPLLLVFGLALLVCAIITMFVLFGLRREINEKLA